MGDVLFIGLKKEQYDSSVQLILSNFGVGDPFDTRRVWRGTERHFGSAERLIIHHCYQTGTWPKTKRHDRLSFPYYCDVTVLPCLEELSTRLKKHIIGFRLELPTEYDNRVIALRRQTSTPR